MKGAVLQGLSGPMKTENRHRLPVAIFLPEATFLPRLDRAKRSRAFSVFFYPTDRWTGPRWWYL